MRVKELGAAAKKFAARAGAAGGDYVSGAVAAAQEYATRALESANTWKAAVAEAAGRGAYERGVQNAGAAAYSDGVQKVGQTRYQQGVTGADAKWSKGFARSAEVLRGLTLSPKGVKGTNMGRANEVATALRAAKLQQ